MTKFRVGTGVILLFLCAAIFAPLLAPCQPGEMDIANRLLPPSPAHWFGFDSNGADVLTSMLYGARTSLYIGLLSTLCSLAVGVPLGLFAGYKRGFLDAVFSRTVDVLMAFPGILLALALTSVLGPNVHNIVFAILATGWIASARLVRGQVLSIREREYVLASKALGGGTWWIVLKHIFPSTWSLLVVQATYSLSGVILIEASLSFLGLGPQEGSPTWGALLDQGRTVLAEAPHLSIIPGGAIMLLVLALNLLGDTLRDRIDPRK